MSSTAPLKSFKRIIIACDGTWTNSDNGFVRKSWLPWRPQGTLAVPSNVTRLCRALLPESTDGIQQVVYYQGGVGSANTFWSFFGGYFGEGISENIREAYSFICNNYEDGDEIILTGFSRGAFTARSVAGLISAIGLLTKHGLGAFYPIFEDWEHQTDGKYEPVYGTPAWPVKDDKTNFVRPKFKDPAYLEQLIKRGLTRPKIPVKAIGVWDTVGALGIPTIKLFGWLPIHIDTTHEFSFVNTEVAPNVEYVYQALALDEVRTPYTPTVWESPPADSHAALKILKQTWFPGVHTSIGGGYADTSISDITLAWMITHLSPHLSFDKKYVPLQRKQNEEFYISKDTAVRPYAMGLIKRSDLGALNTAIGRTTRTPGEYHPTDPETGKILSRPMRATHEFIHPSVRFRIQQHGPGLAESSNDVIGKGEYAPAALKGWRFISADEASDVVGKDWNGKEGWYIERENGTTTFIAEDEIEEGTAEMDLVNGWPGVMAKLY